MFLKDYSIIIPHKDSLHFLPKLFSTLPNSDKVEILLVDNSIVPISKVSVKTDKDFILLYSSPERGAGGARNVGIDHALGKWIIFVDADDFLAPDAFDTYYSCFNSDSEVIYFGMDGIYLDTGERSSRGDSYTQLVNGYINGNKSELDLRLGFLSPCAKMVSHGLINRHHLRFDEVLASNDVFFSLTTGFNAKKVSAIDKITYIATVSKGSLTKRQDFEVLKSRFEVALRVNLFLKSHKLNHYQHSIMFYLFNVQIYGYKKIFTFIKLLFKYKQNPFVGYTRWVKTYISHKKYVKKDLKYFS
jgi:glycosyltransferase involved in cell wall biosynthesis